MGFRCVEYSIIYMGLLGVNPAKTNSKVQFCIFILFETCLVLLIYLVLQQLFEDNSLNPAQIISILSNFFVLLHALLNLSCWSLQKSNINKMVNQMKTRFWKIQEYKGTPIEGDLKRRVRHLQVQFAIFMVILIASWTSFLLGRLLSLREMSYKTLPLQCHVPEVIPIEIMFCWETIHLFLLFFIGGVPLFTMSAITLTSIQFEMLAFELQGIFKNVYTGNEADFFIIRSRIVMCSKHHSFLLSFRSILNETFSTVMVLYMGLMILVLCIGLYALFALDQMEDIFRTLAYVAIFNYEFFACYCLPSQVLLDQSNSIPDTLYFTKWYQFPKLYKTMLLMLCQLRITVTFNLRGIASFGYEIGLQAIRTVVSYCMFLRAIIQ